MPAVSIIILVYGVEQYIERCARALFGQTMEDLEYIFVDDCTPDASMEIMERVLDEFPARRSQVKVLRNDVNRGQAYSRKVGVEAAAGEYIIHCDSDDWPELDMYAKMYAKAKAENLEMVLCQMCVHYDGYIEHGLDKLGAEDLVGALIRQDIYNHLLDKLVSRKLYERSELVWPRCNMCEDSALITQLACNCTSFGYIYEPLYNYNMREGSICASEDTIEKLEQMRENFDLAISCLEARGLAKKYRKDIVKLKCYARNTAWSLPSKYYRSLYPEVNLALLFNNRYTVMDRLGHLTHLLGIRGISKVFKRKKT